MTKVNLENLRHSTAHLLAAAVMELWPQSKRTIGPAIENGFYFDFDFGDIKISENDFPKIEAKMRQLLKGWQDFQRHELSAEEAKKEYPGNPFKHELIDEFSAEGQKLTFYKSGEYWDLCRGGHVDHPDQNLKYFKLLKVAGAYWRGNEKNKMLTRIYGTSFPSQKELEDYLKSLEEAEKRDHRKLGRELDLFSTSPLTGAGLILWHPKLATVRNIVEQFWKDEHYKEGYQLVNTPHIASTDMFVLSRHLSKYIDYMFPIMMHEFIEGDSAGDYSADEVLKPMNCPNHIQIFKARPRSYRDLPVRMGELGTVYRYERAGVLHGMTRVRGFTQDDSHIFCAPEQVIEEVRRVLAIMKRFYRVFGFSGYQAYISTRPEKFLGELKMWDFAEESLKKAAALEGLAYKIDEGAGVFYGPKIDMKVKDSLGREWQLGTVQFDFNQPSRAETTEEEIDEFWNLKSFKLKFKSRENTAKYLKKLGRGFDVTYINHEGAEKQCVMIHRVVLGSMERFFGILIEHYGGAFPLWLSPVQVELIPIAERHLEYAQNAENVLKTAGVRTETDKRPERMQAKIRDHTLQKVPYLGIIGDKEVEKKDGVYLSVRSRDGKDLGQLRLDRFLVTLKEQIEKKF
ncbi:MAG: threonyl-tRNA synthetase, threonyl-tRNA synthetase [Candidatus Gottesmanbacteria bacterium GW2011_GWA2_43_14]|uniref:Threonine--tRNA ligase n=1 Tax=Candidatus Gottesmanbacteria bacterium GW2011_GWA2_43_14 TaxID=1618443 RepID=A0A0G1DKI0_9BACT|nr:MAG: threonyl-tRNA synthetase, threonyl-tRNA synthetase [Candidatus Gottesmanbacteria bacterium GW2011_GWA2_43_14]